MTSRFSMRRAAPFVAAGVLLTACFLLATSAARTKSNTFDEVAHLTAGYAYWTLNDYRLQPENGNLPQRLAAIPAVLEGATFPSLDDPDWIRSDVYAFGRKFFFERGNDIDRLLARGRAMIAILGVLLGLFVCAWSWRTYGVEGALVSLTGFVLCPTLLAHGALATSDMSAALAFTASTGLLWILLGRVTPATLIASSLSTAALFLSKFSAPVIVIVAVALAGIRLFSREPVHLRIGRRVRTLQTPVHRLTTFAIVGFVHVLVIWAAIWASYGFRYEAFHAPARDGEQLLVNWTLVLSGRDDVTRSTIGSAIDFARDQRLLPESYLYGFAHTVKFSQSRRAFMDGEHSLTGWASYFPYAFLIKTPLPVLVLVLIGLVVTLRDPRLRRLAMPWLVLLVVYWIFAITTNLNIGHRHLLPIYPALFILAGGSGLLIRRALVLTRSVPASRPEPAVRGKRKPRPAKVERTPRWTMAHAGAVVTGVLLFWQGVESFGIRPHYLAYFNQLSGGPEQGYKRLVDSSLDWGQDLPALKEWIDRNVPSGSGRPPVYLSYFGTSSPKHFGLDVVPLETYLETRPQKTPAPLLPGYYCVSATMLQGVYLAVNGPWTAKEDETYRMISSLVQARAAALTPEQMAQLDTRIGAKPPEFWTSALTLYDELRTARLMAYLRRRTPDAQAGYSIQIYRLSERDLTDALDGPPG